MNNWNKMYLSDPFFAILEVVSGIYGLRNTAAQQKHTPVTQHVSI